MHRVKIFHLDSPSRSTVLKLFEGMIEWRTMNRDCVKFNWTAYHLSILRAYVSKLSLDSDFKVLSLAMLLKDDSWYRMPARSSEDVGIAASFAQELQEFFVVPKQHQLFERDDAVMQNELMAAFIHMLLLLLHRKEGLIKTVEDRINSLEKELRFLLTLLGDKPLISDEHEREQDLLTEFEAVANEAGSLVHSIVFSTFSDQIFVTIDERLGVFLNHMDFLKACIIKSSDLLQPVTTKANITPKTADVDSLFFLDSLLSDLEDLLNQADNMIVDVEDQNKVQEELKVLKSFINDVKVSRYSEMEELKETMIRVRDLAYEAKYLIDSLLVGDAPLWYFCIRFSHVFHKINLIGIGLHEFKKNYDIGAPTIAANFSKQVSLQTARNSDVNDIIVGLEDDVKNILDQLVGGTNHLQIISIFGMPGLGKTTLAKKLYNHPFVQYKFDRCSWCVVSQTYHRRNLLLDILNSSESELDKGEILNSEEEYLVERIYKRLKGRRYLIVMDDIWNSVAWDDIRRCFPDDLTGSRILFTSRHKDVAPPSSIIYELPSMSDEQCWELLEKKVFQNEHCPPQLLKIGYKIAENCRGVPLAVVVTAGILSSMDREVSTWKNVETNLALYIFSDKNNSMMQILELSYKHLPDHLKPCFLYFGSFREDTKIPVRMLKGLWIAEGFIHREENKSAESVAEEYLMELIDKSLVIVAERRSDGGVKACIIHDLLLDFCLKRSKDENFQRLVGKSYSTYKKRHCLCVCMPLGSHPILGHLEDILDIKLLRLLDLREIKDVNGNLDEISLLVHLRYLAINHVPFPVDGLAWIDRLVNLEYLFAMSPAHIPSLVLVKLTKLRYVKFTSLKFVDEDCNSSQRTNLLEFLSCVVITNLNDEEMLKRSPHLHKLKCDCGALWVEEKGEFRYPSFGFLTQLESLNMNLHKGSMTADVSLPAFPLNIKKLTLSRSCLPWEKMSIIGGLPNLQILKLLHFAFVGDIWETRDGEFQQLRFLKLRYLDLDQWNVPLREHFPKLQQLVLHSCRYLEEIPSPIGEILTLQMIEVNDWCRESLRDSARQIEQEQRDIGNEELKVIFTRVRDPKFEELTLQV